MDFIGKRERPGRDVRWRDQAIFGQLPNTGTGGGGVDGAGPPPAGGAILLEDGFFLLLEDGSKILLE